MRYWYDTEFYEDGERIRLISIGIVAEDGRELYMENEEFDWGTVPVGHWLWENVKPHLHGTCFFRGDIANSVKQFITNYGADHNNELWGYFSAYDHVVLAQLFGRMVDMPVGVPWFTRDIKQEAARLGNLQLPMQTSTQHHALADARWTKEAWEFLRDYAECGCGCCNG